MAKGFPQADSPFVGRAEVLERFRARLEHFRFYLYEGNGGVGKTTLLLQLGRECEAIGAVGAIYLILWPGETIASVLARVESRVFKGKRSNAEQHGDPYGRLIDVLANSKNALLLDSAHNFRRADLLALLRASQNRPGPYRLICASRGDIEISAVDRMGIHYERIGPMTPAGSKEVAEQNGIVPEDMPRFEEDALRGGAVCQPMTLKFMLRLFEGHLAQDPFLKKQTARSLNAFKALMREADDRLTDEEKQVMGTLAKIGLPLPKDVVLKCFGEPAKSVIDKGLLELIDGDVQAHYLLGQLYPAELALAPSVAIDVAKALEKRSVDFAEPMGVLRAAEILAHSGKGTDAVEALTDSWDTARDLGFFEAFLRAVAAIPRGDDKTVDVRLRLLSARARMRQGNPGAVLAEMEELAKERDNWTKQHALAALVYIYSQLKEREKVMTAHAQLKKLKPDDSILIMCGGLAADAMARSQRVDDAAKLARELLTTMKGQKDYQREGDMHRLLARIYAQAGQIKEAIKEASAAAKAFAAGGDLYHSATTHGFIGDLYREGGDFEQAKEAFAKFREEAEQWGDRDLLQIAELSDAWVSLDVGDITNAAKRITAVEKDMSAAASRRLKRYLTSAKALLKAGRGHHAEAASELMRVVEQWDEAGQVSIADVLRAQLVRSLIACGELEEARNTVDEALGRLDEKTSAPRVATFYRESALIRLRKKDMELGMKELAKARKLFAQGGNRREEALTLYRIAHAAVEDGNLEVSKSAAKELSTLAARIKHTRAIALGLELEGRIALLEEDGKEAAKALKEALSSLKKLGDDAGSLHVSEALMRAMLAAGDYTGAIRLGPKVREHADELEIRDVRVRAIVMTGVALLQKGEYENIHRYFREIPERAVNPRTAALMWRYGEAIASILNDKQAAAKRREHWLRAIRRMGPNQQQLTIQMLAQFALPPRERCRLMYRGQETIIGTERIHWMSPRDLDVFIDTANGRYFDSGVLVELDKEHSKLISRLVQNTPRVVPYPDVHKAVYGKIGDDPEKQVKALIKEFHKTHKKAKHLHVTATATGVKYVPPKNHAVMIPTIITTAGYSPHQKKIIKLLKQFALVSLPTIEMECELERNDARKEVTALVKDGLVEGVRAGRGQSYRLA